MQIKLDENLGRMHQQLLEQRGYAANRLLDQGLSGAATLKCGSTCAPGASSS